MESPKVPRSPSRSPKRTASAKGRPSSRHASGKQSPRSPGRGSRKSPAKPGPRQQAGRAGTDQTRTGPPEIAEGSLADRPTPGEGKALLPKLSAEPLPKVVLGNEASNASPASTSKTASPSRDIPSRSTGLTAEQSPSSTVPLPSSSRTTSAGTGTRSLAAAPPATTSTRQVSSSGRPSRRETPAQQDLQGRRTLLAPWRGRTTALPLPGGTRLPAKPGVRGPGYLPGSAGTGNPRLRPQIARGRIFRAFPASTPESSVPSYAIEKSYRCAALVTFAGVVITVLCIFAYVLFSKPARETSELDSLFCRTEDCGMQADILERWLNTSVDPCHDFDGYICSKWVGAQGGRLTTGALGYGLKKWAEGFEVKLRRAIPYLNTAGRVFDVFTKCMADVSKAESRQGVEQLKEFMRELRVPWPEAPSAGVDPLEVVLDLSLNWRVGPWFDVTVLQDGDGTANAILRPASLFWVWSSIEREVEASAAHATIWNGLYQEFAPDQPQRPQAEVDQIGRTHADINEELGRVVKARLAAPLQVHIRHIGAHTVNVSADRWRKALEASSRHPFHPSDNVTFADKTLLEAVNNIFLRYNDTSVMWHLSWTFIQVFSSIADRDFLTHKLGSQTLARRQRRSFCATEVEAAYRWIVVSLLVAADFPRDSRDTIDASLNKITQTVASLLENATWADPGSGKALGDKVRNVSVTLWPSEGLLTEEGLSKLHAGWFSNASTFTESWINAARNWRKLATRGDHAEVTEHPLNVLVPFVRYDHFLNAVRVALVALSRPWYYAKGTKAMDYGALGFFYALQLVRSFDSVGIQVDPNGRITDSWLPAGTKDALAKKASCLGPQPDAYGEFFPEIVAMEAVHAAYEAATTEYDRSLKVFHAFSEDQLFFVAACVTICGLHDADPALRVSCNKAVSQMAAFANAFRCPEGAAMNPARKCAFFT
ncbi:endothelin-converting enzyme 1-like isoform X2 [Dermacentor albipictus]|uniref:endothelin-converting enzyme 1-like isoform X2 n=1 Tax=Dermacentor albipictus TaxID=60249 RepID=UPI0038FC14EE